MILRKLNAREKMILTVAVCLLVVHVLGRLLLAPLLTRNILLDAQIKAVQERGRRYLSLMALQEPLRRAYPQFFAGTPGAMGAGSTSALSELGRLAQEAGLVVVDMRPQSSGEGGRRQVALIEVTATGSIQQHVAFLYGLETSLSLMKVKHAVFSPRSRAAVLEGRYMLTPIAADRSSRPGAAIERTGSGEI